MIFLNQWPCPSPLFPPLHPKSYLPAPLPPFALTRFSLSPEIEWSLLALINTKCLERALPAPKLTPAIPATTRRRPSLSSRHDAQLKLKLTAGVVGGADRAGGMAVFGADLATMEAVDPATDVPVLVIAAIGHLRKHGGF